MNVAQKNAVAGNVYITDYAQLPPHHGLLSAASDTPLGPGDARKLKVPRDKELELAALSLAGNSFFVLSSQAELHSLAWYQLVNEGKALGLNFQGYAIAAREIFALLFYRAGDEERNDQQRNDMDDARVIEQLMASSASLEWFRGVVQRCVELGASDMHLELRGSSASLRVRLDGIMRSVSGYPFHVALDGISAAYTVLAEERSRTEVAFNASIAQAAMIPLELPAHRLTLRYQSHPAVGGFDVVIRILKASDPSKNKRLKLEMLGYTEWQTAALEDALRSAWGGVFVAGVTGSGKTTTLNTLLASLARDGSRKLVTIEDPVEYELPGVTHMSIQRQAESAAGSAGAANPFHAAMMAFLRMDPDVGLFGEVRDAASARMAQATIQTGHKLLSTVHATSALGVISRLTTESLGLKRQDICQPEFISALVYQVLMPLNCEHCKIPARQVMSEEELGVYQQGFGLDPDAIFCASDDGCEHCRKDGINYSSSKRNGTAGVKVGAEVIVPDMKMFSLLLENRDQDAKAYWRSRRKADFFSPDMDGKEAWGHVLYDISQGKIDPYYFERTFGNPSHLAQLLH